MSVKKIFFTFGYVVLSYCFFMTQVFAETMQVTKAEVEQFVKQAKEHALKVGKEQALKDFMDAKNTQFRKGSLYIFAQDYKGINLAHIKGDLVGSNMMGLKDPKGVMFIQQMTELAKSPEGGWFDYLWQNPATNKVERKSTFVLNVDFNYWLGAGIYESEIK